ncbi:MULTISPECIES: hypothetical protein [unclassified Colwellia]|uniref:hypothetical protein n=1 Tax=unclassified Colwellia TaxID=196834 RepID=UPI0015F60147|nr:MULTISPECIES: hypothetical protein [unclassified Colwellia]MBA6364943.1 hypothetical protein [Colwellia sp. BRX8-8]MBA6349900.1 hypothetical protein [Colwellia sp. BRX8-9]MBA6356613.1 hypothetical protein [Colwellia sp. BRX8-3]MBA6361173.1 hypothetical protein [Colwellia sp. BRX8-6]MBA6368413.1 hypothetical protein [Colwellia sp. BRX8-5]
MDRIAHTTVLSPTLFTLSTTKEVIPLVVDKGMGRQNIVKYLNETYPSPLPKTKKKVWNISP